MLQLKLHSILRCTRSSGERKKPWLIGVLIVHIKHVFSYALLGEGKWTWEIGFAANRATVNQGLLEVEYNFNTIFLFT